MGSKRSPLIIYLKRKILINPYIRHSTIRTTDTEDEETEKLNLVVSILIFGSVAYLLGFVSGHVLSLEFKSGSDFFNLSIAVLLPLLFSLEIIKHKVDITYKTIVRRLTKRGLENKSEMDELNQKYYLSRIVFNSDNLLPLTEIIDYGLPLEGIYSSICQQAMRDGPEKYKRNLEKEFEEAVQKQQIRCKLISLSDEDFFRPISLAGAMYALGIDDKYRFRAGMDCHLFWRDIYLYMKAWVVCTIESRTGTALPLETIGLNYPSKETPNKRLYKKAFNYICMTLLNSEQSKRQIGTESDATIKSMQEAIVILITMLDDYPLPSSE